MTQWVCQWRRPVGPRFAMALEQMQLTLEIIQLLTLKQMLLLLSPTHALKMEHMQLQLFQHIA